MQNESVETFIDERFSYGIGHSFPKDWTDEQCIEWNNANCHCPFHARQREAKGNN